ncbi:hypothetical protein JS81_14975 [Thermoactinomyces sp. Gus2-1]|jgi:hypothetical protein|nr:hypothetical protein JS81_14975 [Thermoactinomyces sp. Gus2-1]
MDDRRHGIGYSGREESRLSDCIDQQGIFSARFCQGIEKNSSLENRELMRHGIGEIWFGRSGSVYEGIQARIESITPRNVQVSYDRIVQVNGSQLAGEVMSKKRFREMFDRAQQLNLFG